MVTNFLEQCQIRISVNSNGRYTEEIGSIISRSHLGKQKGSRAGGPLFEHGILWTQSSDYELSPKRINPRIFELGPLANG